MIPIPYVIYYAVTFPMQLFSTKIAVFFLDLFSLPVTSQGNIINLPNYQLEVVEACSGIRSLMTLTALGAAMAYMTQKTVFSGIIVFLFSIPIAIGANVFRIFITAIGAYTISPKFAEGFIHEASGLIVFLVGFLSLGGVAMMIKWFGNIKDYDPLVSG
jgi:exosortase